MIKIIQVSCESREELGNGLVAPNIGISVIGEWDADDIAGSLLIAYLQAAETFMEGHKHDGKPCHNCPGYMFNLKMVEAIKSAMLKFHIGQIAKLQDDSTGNKGENTGESA